MVIFCCEGELASSFEAVDYEVGQVGAALVAHGCRCKQFRFMVDYALRELLNNAVEHANRLDLGKKVKYSVCYDTQFFEITVWDEGDTKAVLSAPRQGFHSEFLVHRRRGLSSIRALGFELDLQPGKVVARLRNNRGGSREEKEKEHNGD